MEFLQKASAQNGWSHDPDARFNSLFPSLANDANVAYGSPDPFFLDLRDTTAVKCQNGTKFQFANNAFVRANFTNIKSGADLYKSFGPSNGTGEQAISWHNYRLAERNYTSTFSGYPQAARADKAGYIAGFLPEGPGVSDVAILSVKSFLGNQGPAALTQDPVVQLQDFYNVTIDFLRTATATNRSKLILDVQGNSGGLVSNLATLYFALFPSQTFPLLFQGRAHPQLAWLGAQLWNNSDPNAFSWPFQGFVKPDSRPWTSFAEFYGPYNDTSHPPRGAYTHLAQYKVQTNTSGQFSIPVLPPWSTPPFRAQDITILTDGQCGSACALLVEMLTHAHGVRTVALGGRPLAAPMQAVGQAKGGPVMSFASFPDFDRAKVPEGLRMPPVSLSNKISHTSYKPPLRLAGIDLLGWGAGVSFNVANMLPFGEEKGGLPLQMRYEAANCKLFFTWEMAREIEAVWRAVAGVAWRGSKCVRGSTTNGDGTIGGVPGFVEGVEDRYELGRGPGEVGPVHKRGAV